jgi:hypothetical protein
MEQIADLLERGTLSSRQAALTVSPPRDHSKWHVSNLLKAADDISRGRDQNLYASGGSPNGIMSMGRIWESVVDVWLRDFAAVNSGNYVPNVTLECDDIVASLDGMLYLPTVGMAVSETKLRFTVNREIPSRHLQQIKCYCHCLETRLVQMVVGHITSNPPAVTARLITLSLTAQEIAETWQMVLKTKEYLQRLGVVPGSDLAVEA